MAIQFALRHARARLIKSPLSLPPTQREDVLEAGGGGGGRDAETSFFFLSPVSRQVIGAMTTFHASRRQNASGTFMYTILTRPALFFCFFFLHFACLQQKPPPSPHGPRHSRHPGPSARVATASFAVASEWVIATEFVVCVCVCVCVCV
jgi:hypothetical protein